MLLWKIHLDLVDCQYLLRVEMFYGLREKGCGCSFAKGLLLLGEILSENEAQCLEQLWGLKLNDTHV